MDRETICFYDRDPDGYAQSVMCNDVSSLVGRFSALLNPGARVLDLGCGPGRDTISLISEGFDVMPVDGSEGMCAVASRNTGLDVVRMDIADLDFDGEFDGVWANASLLHLHPDEIPIAFRSILRALRPGGVLFVSFKRGGFRGRRDGRWYTDLEPDRLGELASTAGFGAIRIWTGSDSRGTDWTYGLFRRP